MNNVLTVNDFDFLNGSVEPSIIEKVCNVANKANELDPSKPIISDWKLLYYFASYVICIATDNGLIEYNDMCSAFVCGDALWNPEKVQCSNVFEEVMLLKACAVNWAAGDTYDLDSKIFGETIRNSLIKITYYEFKTE